MYKITDFVNYHLVKNHVVWKEIWLGDKSYCWSTVGETMQAVHEWSNI